MIDTDALALLPEEDKLELIDALEEKINQHERTRLSRYKPYPKQLEFHAADGDPNIREILLMAPNQVGKTLSCSAGVAMHLSGQYPDWWPGARFQGNVSGWAASETAQGTRDSVQRLLLGPPGAWGTGMIPGDAILDIKRAASAVPDCVDTVMVKRADGGVGRLVFKTYDQGRERWQAESLDFVWFDEEPDEDIYFEGTTRTNATGGVSWLTFTPLKGMSKVVKRFLKEKAPGTHIVRMTLEDALHYTSDDRARLIAKYPAHELQARAYGSPALGSGAIYPFDEAKIKEPMVEIPGHWPRICGMDFGWDHPTAAVWLAWDRDTDIIHLYDVYKAKEQTPVIHSAAIKARGEWIPIAWPHDGLQTGKDGGKPLATQYRKLGCNMLPNHATHPPREGQDEGTGGYEVWAGITELQNRMQTGRFRVAAHLEDFWSEFRTYYMKDGKIVKEDDDVVDAVRIGCMMLRHAKTKPAKRQNVAAGFQAFDPTMGY